MLLLLLACGPRNPTLADPLDDSYGAELGRLELPPAAALWLDGARAFACAGDDGVYAVDVSDPVRPRLDAHLDLPCRDIQGESGKLYVAALTRGVQVLHPGSLTVLGSHEAEGEVQAIALDPGEHRLWLARATTEADGEAGLVIEDLPTWSAEHLVPSQQLSLAGGPAAALVWDRQTLALLGEDGTLRTFDEALAAQGELELGAAVVPAGARQQGEGLWIAHASEGLSRLELDDPSLTAPRLSRLPTPAWGLAVVGDRLYLGAAESLEVWDVSEPTAPQALPSIPLPGLPRPQGLQVADGRATVVDAEEGVLCIVSVREEG